MPDKPTFEPDERYRFLGHDITIRSESRLVLDYIRSLYGRFRIDATRRGPGGDDHSDSPATVITFTGSPERVGELRVEDMFGARTLGGADQRCADDHGTSPGESSLPPVIYVQLPLLNTVAALAEDFLIAHGASLSCDAGAVIVPAPSGYGKTTLCLELMRQGARILSDEAACVQRSDRHVHPFPRTVRFDEETRRLTEIPKERLRQETIPLGRETQWLLDPETVFPAGYGAASELRVALFLQGFGDSPRIEPISTVTAVFELARLTIRPPGDPATALVSLAPLLNGIPCYNLVAGDLKQTAGHVRRLLDELPRSEKPRA